MKCLVTGASSGIGKDMSKYLSKLGHHVIMVSCDIDKLKKASLEVDNSSIFKCDLSKKEEVDNLLDFIKQENPDVVINDAGFGAFGFYDEIDINKEIDMINVNVIALHRITKYCLEYMNENNYILNVASVAGLLPGGPLLSSYYATKSYVRSYTLSVYEELRRKNKKVNISVLCPGPVNTNFNKVAGGHFSINSLESEYVAKYAIDKMFKKKVIIIPGILTKMGAFIVRLLPSKVVLRILYHIEHKKR